MPYPLKLDEILVGMFMYYSVNSVKRTTIPFRRKKKNKISAVISQKTKKSLFHVLDDICGWTLKKMRIQTWCGNNFPLPSSPANNCGKKNVLWPYRGGLTEDIVDIIQRRHSSTLPNSKTRYLMYGQKLLQVASLGIGVEIA